MVLGVQEDAHTLLWGYGLANPVGHLYRKTDQAGIQKTRLGAPKTQRQLSGREVMQLWILVSWQ